MSQEQNEGLSCFHSIICHIRSVTPQEKCLHCVVKKKSVPSFCYINNSLQYQSPPLCLSSLYEQNVSLFMVCWLCLSFHSLIFLCQLILMLYVCVILCVASTLRDRPWSAIFSPEEHSVIIPSRRPTSIMPFHSSNLSKSMSINNIAMLVPKHTHTNKCSLKI